MRWKRRRNDPDRITVAGSGAATAYSGYANSGIQFGDVNLVTGTPVRTQYRHQVQRIAPPDLEDRDAELAELTTFATSPATAGTYAWWRAEAWSGKTALMSWFVLHPPAGVRLVSFFVTAHFAAQNDRHAFIDNLTEQLLALLGQHWPPDPGRSRQETNMLGLLTDAAEACAVRGEHFVLLVDGLDEDRSVHAGPDSHSIAALLPATLPAGMRVMVTGKAETLASVAEAVAKTGDFDRAEHIARAIMDGYWRGKALARVSGAMAEAGEPERAAGVLDDAEQIARSIESPVNRVNVLVSVAEAAGAERAGPLLDDAVRIARTIDFPYSQADALAWVAKAVAKAGDVDRAGRLAHSITLDRSYRAKALVALARIRSAPHRERWAADILRLDDWPLAIDVLAELAPEAPDVILAELAAVGQATTG